VITNNEVFVAKSSSKKPRNTQPAVSGTESEPEPEVDTLSMKEHSRDIDEFFDGPETVQSKKKRPCKYCRSVDLSPFTNIS